MRLNQAFALILFLQTALPPGAPAADEVNYARLANSTLGTKGKGFGVAQRYLEAGYTFPGATVPFGMTQFTTTFFDENKGFVINQMSGAGCHNMGNLPFLPMKGEIAKAPGDMMGYAPAIEIHEAHAGYYSASLFGDIAAELTTTRRTGMARLKFGRSAKGTIIIGTGINSTEMPDARATITGSQSFEGYADGGSFCGSPSNYRLYFVAEFSVAPESSGSWKEASLSRDTKDASGANSGLFFTFDTKAHPEILYKVGVSYVSIENARENLRSENLNWNFDDIVQLAETQWNQVLRRIQVDGDSKDRLIQFYSHLYHVLVHPSIFDDVNGEYMGADMQVHQVKAGDHYTAFSNWDTYRTQAQLLSLLVPERASQMAASMLTFAQESGGSFPRWVLANFETGIMQGDPTSIWIANAYAFGARDFDTRTALQIMRRGAEIPGVRSQNVETRPHLEQYLEQGFIHDQMGASMLLEYSSADFAIGQFAKQALDNEALYRAYLERSKRWTNLVNPETQWLQSRFQDGSWKPQTDDWREASYKNYFWMIPHDLPGLLNSIGGGRVAEPRLDEFFQKLNANYHEEFFAAGNEPSFQSPWTYNWIGKPHKTQKTVRRILTEQYSNRDCGLPGNDDMGAMAAWYVLASMGIYPMVPGVAGFSLSAPVFREIKIHLQNGKEITIKGGSESLDYIAGLKVNGKEWNNTWLPYGEIEHGGVLEFELSAQPTGWGSENLPPDFMN